MITIQRPFTLISFNHIYRLMLSRDTGASLYALIEKLYPMCRSMTGNGVRRTLQIIREMIPVDMIETPTGTRVFDWNIPKEWNIREAWIKNSAGEKIVCFSDSNLHVVSNSIPVNCKISRDELIKHIHTQPGQPDVIPYRTAFFREEWGFCLTGEQWAKLTDETYHVFIDASLEEGSLTHGELFIRGESDEEMLISTHICHPSLCNDNLSGISVAVHLARKLMDQQPLRFSYRFLFIPTTIGSINWLASNRNRINRIRYGLVISCLGDPGERMTYKKSRSGHSEIDRIVEQALSDAGSDFEIRDFDPFGHDERQFCSPAFDLPMGLLMRTPYGEFPEYHTSADNLDFIRPARLAESLARLGDVVHIIEQNGTYINRNPMCEPNLGKRGLYGTNGRSTQDVTERMALLWVLNLSDGGHSLLDIAGRSAMPFNAIRSAADALLDAGLLEESTIAEEK